MTQIEEIREKLKKFVTFQEGTELRNLLHTLAVGSYKQKYSHAEYIDFMETYEVKIEKNGAQQTNFPYYYSMFTIPTQHIVGDTVKELLDKAIDIVKGEVEKPQAFYDLQHAQLYAQNQAIAERKMWFGEIDIKDIEKILASKMKRSSQIGTGKAGYIMFLNAMREEVGAPPLTQEQEDQIEEGSYIIGDTGVEHFSNESQQPNQ